MITYLPHRRQAFRGGAGNGLLTNLVALWELNESSNGSGAVTREDSHSGNYDLTDNGTVASASGKLGNCGVFTLGQVTFLGNSSADLRLASAGAFSVASWVYRNGNQFDTTGIANNMGIGVSQPGYGLLIMASHKIRMYVRDSAAWKYAESNDAIADTTFVHAVGTFDGSAIRLYINGVLQTTTDSVTSRQQGTQDFLLGAYNAGGAYGYLNGRIDQTGIWDAALTVDHALALYNSNDGLAYPSFTS